ncbi:DUF296 domain-containing protein [Fulvimarina sp. 2208YS6-2-32]|uniref:DUF296 domain-containing protein n=1 Tax=Fulvimarina uroteuthidis TaxID=3098149 RepID=A0ABU5I605_9HYPH|nr:DUF296 domain-containing protein [Fulvimarina sp. 2208YS6-2-32]MDY8110183.1 DUF296 domain-containing protein [Fulvimarina sp. 2208YS6-2-32]
MDAAQRTIRHPGPVAKARHAMAWGERVALQFTIDPGETIEAGLSRGVAEAGCAAAYVEMAGARLSPFRYVGPAGSPGPDHAAWYSEPVAPEDGVAVARAGAIVGQRDDAPFVHCHGLWRAGGRGLAMGHMLPPDCIAQERVAVSGIGVKGSAFRVRDDAETNFRLFAAEALPGPNGRGALLLTLRPNQDVTRAIEAIALAENIPNASIHGIGSLNEARFEDGPPMRSYASELLIRNGQLRGGRARIDVAVVAMDGAIFEGVLVRGDNPVCVTFELVIVPDEIPT